MASNELQLQKCQNCEKEVSQEVMPLHFSYCRRNFKKCDVCELMYDVNYKEEHEEEQHKKQKCINCSHSFLKRDIDKHRQTCKPQETYCGYCELNVPNAQFKDHLIMCQSKTKICQKCGLNIVNKNYFDHVASCQSIVIIDQPVEELPENNPKKQNKEKSEDKDMKPISKAGEIFKKRTKRQEKTEKQQKQKKKSKVIDCDDSSESKKKPSTSVQPIELNDDDQPQKKLQRSSRTRKKVKKD